VLVIRCDIVFEVSENIRSVLGKSDQYLKWIHF
jgi:hypothetical protein